MRKILLALLAVFALSSANLHASTLDLTLTTGLSVDPLGNPTSTTFDGVSAQQYTYTHQVDCVVGIGGCLSVLSSSTSVFTITVADVTPALTLVNVNDVCTDVVVIGSAPPCQSFAFSATDVVLGDGQTGIGAAAGVLALADVNIGVGFANLNIDGVEDGPQLLGASVQGAGDEFQFTAATPEPSSLALLGTGLAGLGGFIRRRLNA